MEGVLKNWYIEMKLEAIRLILNTEGKNENFIKYVVIRKK